MKIKNRFKFFLGTLFFFTIALNLNSSALAIEDEVALRILNGLQKVFLNVAPISPILEEKGLNGERLKADMEEQLQESGIDLISEKEFDRLRYSQNFPLCRLELFVNAAEIKDKDVMIYNIVIQVQQVAFLARKPGIRIYAPSWQKGQLSYSYGSGVDTISKVVSMLTDKFIKAFLEANKKK